MPRTNFLKSGAPLAVGLAIAMTIKADSKSALRTRKCEISGLSVLRRQDGAEAEVGAVVVRLDSAVVG